MCIEVVVIIKMSEEAANDLNTRSGNGLQIYGAMEARELNSGHSMHGKINSRVFIIRGEVGKKCSVILPPNIKSGKANFTIPPDKEYIEVKLTEA